LHANKPLPVIRSIFRLLKTGDEMGDYHVQVSAWSSRFYATLTNLISLNVKAEVRGGVIDHLWFDRNLVDSKYLNFGNSEPTGYWPNWVRSSGLL